MYNISSHVHVYIMFEVLKFDLNFKTKNIISIDFVYGFFFIFHLRFVSNYNIFSYTVMNKYMELKK